MMMLVLLVLKLTINSKTEDGCPDLIADNKITADTDGDGIVDNVDLCPNQPETFNGISKTKMVALTSIDYNN